jgi:hypothetical protein
MTGSFLGGSICFVLLVIFLYRLLRVLLCLL